MNGSSLDFVRFDVAQLLLAKMEEHASLDAADRREILSVPFQLKVLDPEQDVVSQGDRPEASIFVLSGMLARYHTLQSGDRQYLSFHIAGDMPDVQSLLLTIMDHSVCAMNEAVVAYFPHGPLLRALRRRSSISLAFWRMTLIDAAIFRQAITNNSRSPVARLAHLFCEQYYRAKEGGLAKRNSCSMPLTQNEIGQALGISGISVHRALRRLRRARIVDFSKEVLTVHDWQRLVQVSGFDPLYLHIA